jgi:hypothetical protein
MLYCLFRFPRKASQAVSWQNAQIFQRFRAMEQQQLSSGDPLKCPKARHLFIGEQRLGRL